MTARNRRRNTHTVSEVEYSILLLDLGDAFCWNGDLYEVVSGAVTTTLQTRDWVTTESFGVSQVVKSESVNVEIVRYRQEGPEDSQRIGPC